MARIAASLDTLRTQFNVGAPRRDKSSDGWIGNAEHAARKSDHNPNAAGVVTALDITHDPGDGVDTYKIAEHMRQLRDPRVEYVISNGRIWNSRVSPFVWRGYDGDNPHNHHMHVSVHDEEDLYDNPGPWALVLAPADPNAPRPKPKLQFGSTGDEVREVQQKLSIAVDGIFGAETERAVRAFQTAAGLESDGIVGPYTWSKLGGTSVTPYKRQTGIIATVFGGVGDPNYSAYDASHFINDTELGVALPFRFAGPRPQVRVFKGGKSVVCNIVDVGPIYPHPDRGPADPYWETNTRPRADTNNVLSEAGIDLTPAAARAIGLDGKGIVDWEFVTKEVPVPTPTVEERLAALEKGIQLILDALKINPPTDPVVKPDPVTVPVVKPPVVTTPPPVVVEPPKDTTGLLPALLSLFGYFAMNAQNVVGSVVGPAATPTGQTVFAGLALAALAASQGSLAPGITTLFKSIGQLFAPAKPAA